MNGATATWLEAHGKLWYDDRWYRTAWIVGPQALALFAFVTLWLAHPAGQPAASPDIPWAKPATESQKPAEVPKPQPTAQPPIATDPLAPCRGEDYARIIGDCSAVLASGALKGDGIAEGYYRRGWAYYRSNQYQSAMGDFDRAVALNPKSELYYNDRGILWRDLKNLDRAMQDFDQALLINPNYAISYANRGVILRTLKRPNEALTALNSAISLDPKLSYAYENRARLYVDRSNWQGVYDDANKLIELNPNDQLGYQFRGQAYLEVGQYEPSIDAFTKAISLDSSSLYSWRTRGFAYYRLNQFDAALSDYQAALKIDPQDSLTLDYINDVRTKQRRR